MAGEMQQPGVQSATPQVSGPRAGFGSRLVAIVIDGIILGVIGFVISFGLLTAVGGTSDPEAAAGVLGIIQLIQIVVAIAYFGLQEGSARGQTVGKRLLGIRVIDFNTGQSIGVGRAILRYLARILSTIPLFLGYFWMLWDPQNQTWHDKLLSDVVVPEAAYPIHAAPGGSGNY